jgi:tetratricopeptide (TPR) repeat protein
LGIISQWVGPGRDAGLSPGRRDGVRLRYTLLMMISCRSSGLAACLLAGALAWAGSAPGADSVAVIGANPHLANGARALFVRDYDSGIRHTLAGLKEEVAVGQRTAALSNLCAGYVGAQRYAEAVAACTEAIDLRRTNWRAFNNRAIAYFFQGNFVAARADLAAGLALNPDSGQLHKVQAMLQARDPVLLAEAD